MIRLGIDWRECERGKTTGIGRYLQTLVRYLLRPGNDWDLRLYGNEKTEWEPYIPDRMKRFIPERGTVWWDQVLLPRRLRRDHCHLFLSPYFKAPLLARCPVVVILNDFIPHSLYYQTLLRWNLIRARGIIAISNATKADLLRHLPGAGAKTAVIPLGVDPHFSPGPANPALEKKHALRPPYLLCVGNANPHKNLARLIRALPQIPGVQLVLAGADPKTNPQLAREAAAAGVLDRTLFIPHFPEEELPDLYRGAELFVFPSLAEGFGLTPLEAMACGTPVVASRIPATEEVLGDAAFFMNAKLVDEIAVAVKTVLGNSFLRDTLARQGRERAASFNVATMASSMSDFLRMVYLNRNRGE